MTAPEYEIGLLEHRAEKAQIRAERASKRLSKKLEGSRPTAVWLGMSELEQGLFVASVYARYASLDVAGLNFTEVLGITPEVIAGPLFARAQVAFLAERAAMLKNFEEMFE